MLEINEEVIKKINKMEEKVKSIRGGKHDIKKKKDYIKRRLSTIEDSVNESIKGISDSKGYVKALGSSGQEEKRGGESDDARKIMVKGIAPNLGRRVGSDLKLGDSFEAFF